MIYHGDCLEILPTLPAESIDSIVTDPPYGLSFMGKNWDHGVPGVAFWSEALRVAKPGTHLLAFGGTRTFHRLTCAIEDAGWEIRDCIMWVYGSGFPKSHDVSKAIDREAGAEREVVGSKHVTNCAAAHQDGYNRIGGKNGYDSGKAIAGFVDITAPATPAAQQWQGWGTALKPAWEPIIMARKPLVGTVAKNVQAFGTGAVNVDGCRIPCEAIKASRNIALGSSGSGICGPAGQSAQFENHESGRWPANLIHDGSDEVVGLFPETGPAKAAARGGTNPNPMDWGNGRSDGQIVKGHNDNGGSAARFFYCAKASKADRDEGCEGIEAIHRINGNKWTDQDYRVTNGERQPGRESGPRSNHHPTVKPTSLMRYLCRLVTPPGGTVLDPFCGSGSTGKAAMLEGFEFIGIEREAEYVAIAQARIAHARGDMPLLEAVS